MPEHRVVVVGAGIGGLCAALRLAGQGLAVTLVDAGDDGTLTIYVRERAVEGKATEAVAAVLAKYLGVARSRVELVSGATSRVKRFRVRD